VNLIPLPFAGAGNMPEFWSGFAAGGWDSVRGSTEAITDPLASLESLQYALTHPGQVGSQLWASTQQFGSDLIHDASRASENYGRLWGQIAGEAATGAAIGWATGWVASVVKALLTGTRFVRAVRALALVQALEASPQLQRRSSCWARPTRSERGSRPI